MLHAKGPLLTVDVDERNASQSDIDSALEQFVGGRALATALAHDRIPFDADPFGQENRVYLSTGPLQQSQMSFTGRMNMTGLSPLTDGLVSSNAGGYLSREFTGTGISTLELVGQSDELLLIHVTDDGVQFEEVPELAGAVVPEVSEYVAETHNLGPEHCAVIGPAGENLVRYASVMTYDARAFGRGGLGAVLGSKNVKGVTFNGDSEPEIEIPDPPESEIHRDAATSEDIRKRQGTNSSTEIRNEIFSLPTRYFSEYSFEDAAAIGGEAIEEKKYKNASCSACAFACKLPLRDEGTGFETEGPEFETVFSFGSNQGVGDLVEVMKANELCDTLGMDTVSAGVTIAAYLASENEFGNAELAQELTKKIARREGIGDLLAEGVDRCHEDLGVENWSVKGLEFAAHDGRVLHGQGLSYAVANRGADHMYSVILKLEYNGDIDSEGTLGKAETLVDMENYAAFRDTGIICEFSDGYISEEHLEQLFDADYAELLTIGAQTVSYERHFNNHRGFDRTDDRLPYDLPHLKEAIGEYYDARGWNTNGVVPDSSIESAEISGS